MSSNLLNTPPFNRTTRTPQSYDSSNLVNYLEMDDEVEMGDRLRGVVQTLDFTDY